MKNNSGGTNGKKIGLKITKNAVAWILSIVMLVPIYLILVTSFKGGSDAKTLTFALPVKWVFTNFGEVIREGKLINGFLNSMLYTTVGTIITVLLAAMSAYIFSRRRSIANRILYMYIVMGMVLPVNYVALMKVMQFLHLNNTRAGIIMLYIAIQSPFIVFLIYGFIAKVPVELDEAALIDGCGPLRLFFGVIFPLMKPVLITATVLCFLNMWNEFVMPLYFLNATD